MMNGEFFKYLEINHSPFIIHHYLKGQSKEKYLKNCIMNGTRFAPSVFFGK
jgi:hypothetical protein